MYQALKHRISFAIFLSVFISMWASLAAAESTVHYHIEFLPDSQKATVRIELEGDQWMEYAHFNGKGYNIEDIKATGELEHDGDVFTWRPDTAKAELSYTVEVSRQRRSGGYDAYMTDDWTLLRGERLVPPVRVWRPDDAVTTVYATYTLPDDWPSINTGWTRVRGNTFRIDNPDFILPRPAGWIVAGKLTTRHQQLGDTLLMVSAPLGQNFKPLEKLAFVSLIWPEVDKAFPEKPEKILITGAADPMWRGGLSAPNSYYIHSDRPLVSANGTSTIIHELMHVITGIRGKPMHNWIAEGIVEYYTTEFLYRSGAFSAERKKSVVEGLREWSKEVDTLLHKNSTGRVSARAAVLFHDLDAEIQAVTDKKYRLDDLVHKVMPTKILDDEDLRKAFKAITGAESKVLQTPLLVP